MPLQELEDKSKKELLQRIISKEYSIKEMGEAASRIKQKNKMQKIVMK